MHFVMSIRAVFLAIAACSAARADYLATQYFSSDEPYNISTSCEGAPVSYNLIDSPCRADTNHNTSVALRCINATYVTEMIYYNSTTCSGDGVPAYAPSPTSWCKPKSGSYTASNQVCMTGSFMASAPASGKMSFSWFLQEPDQLCPNPAGPFNGANLQVQSCTGERTCQQLGSSQTVVSECVVQGQPVPPPVPP